MEDVDRQLAQAAPACRRRREQRAPRRLAEAAEPGVEDRRRVLAVANRRAPGRRGQPQRLGDLRDVEDRDRPAVEDERRDRGAAQCLPPALALATVARVQRLELDPPLAKELPGRRAARSGRVPEEGDAAHCAA